MPHVFRFFFTISFGYNTRTHVCRREVWRVGTRVDGREREKYDIFRFRYLWRFRVTATRWLWKNYSRQAQPQHPVESFRGGKNYYAINENHTVRFNGDITSMRIKPLVSCDRCLMGFLFFFFERKSLQTNVGLRIVSARYVDGQEIVSSNGAGN